MLKPLLLLISLLIPFALAAQANYKNGYVVTLPGDTLEGFISYREWAYNPKEINFKSSLTDANIQSFTPENLKSFNIIGFEAYEAFEVSLTMDDINPNGILEESETTKLTSKVFLKTVLSGDRVSIFRYKDKTKERFYFLDNGDNSPIELVNQFYLEAGNIKVHKFKQQLTGLALKYKNFPLSQQIQLISYSKTDILNIVKQINTHNITAFNKNLEKKPKAIFFIGSGLTYSSITYRGENLITIDRMVDRMDNYRDKVVTQSYLPKFSAGADIFINPEIRRTIIRGEITATAVKSEPVSYLKYNSISEREQRNTYNLSFYIISAIPQIRYNLYNKENFKLYLGTGTAFSYYLTNENKLNRVPADNPDGKPDAVVEDYIKIKKMGLNLILRSGIILNEKIELGILYFNPTEISNYVSAKAGSAKTNNIQLNLNYLFNRK